MNNNMLLGKKIHNHLGGAPVGNTNASTHNRYSRENRRIYRETISLLHDQQAFLADFNSTL